MLKSRLLRLDKLMASNKIDAIVLNPGPSLVYLTGLHFHLMERPTLFVYHQGGAATLILPELEGAKLAGISLPFNVHTFGDDPSTWQSVFDLALAKWNSKSVLVGVEPNRLRFLEMEYLQKAAPLAKLLSGESVIGVLRSQKDDHEIECMRKAVQIAQKGLLATLPFIKPGISEEELASELIIQLYKAGSSPELPFMPIIASGPNSANPHAVPTSRKLQNGDLLVIDWGAAYEDYCSDLTRTFAIGEPSSELMEIYKTVQAANAVGRAVGKPGLPAGAVDDVTRRVIDQAGYGKYFTHRTGHGLGMEAHESPYMFAGNQLELAPGMTYTVEPGIYLPGIGGVRIEDNIVVTDNGCESLSDMPRDLKVL
ncbi:MAG: aminopeptidase P family protein [Chloroflexi bacterium HGW-Chloroflexi-7]|nr:MAG: aminopeptidase P family protein [Chloroflexi bacterium HGW-Chloroflexi-7]